MKPLGRKYYLDKSGGKHGLRVFGKFSAWWTSTIEPSKTRDKIRVKLEIQQELADEGECIRHRSRRFYTN